MRDRQRELAGVAEVLVPYTAFAAADLAQQLNDIVIANTEILASRGIAGVIRRYSDLSSAEKNIRKGQFEHPKLGHFAVINSAGSVRGSASIIPNLPLTRQRIPLPPAFVPGFLTDSYPTAGPNVHAWTDKSEQELLCDAYSELTYKADDWWKYIVSPQVWTVEPNLSPIGVHQAIKASGLEMIATRRFDDGESRRRRPPQSTLYANLSTS